MSLRQTYKQIERLKKRERAALELAARPEREREAVKARKVIDIWNRRLARGVRALYFPTLETAIAAGTPVLSFMCPACRQCGELDLRTIDRHRAMTISGLIPQLSCKRCCPNPPFVKLLRLRP